MRQQGSSRLDDHVCRLNMFVVILYATPEWSGIGVGSEPQISVILHIAEFGSGAWEAGSALAGYLTVSLIGISTAHCHCHYTKAMKKLSSKEPIR